MKIVVCIKQVPDTSEVKLDVKTNTLIREGVPSIINPDDKAGIETALKLKDCYPNISVTLLSMGPLQAKKALIEGLAMGCDEAVLISDRMFGGSDTLATSTIIAAALKKINYDLIITGRQAIDGDTAQVGPQIAEHLKLPQAGYAVKIGFDGREKITVHKMFEDFIQILEIKIPCLLTVSGENIIPRFMSVRGIIDAFDKKKVNIWGYDDLKQFIGSDEIGLNGSPTKVKRSFVKPMKNKGMILKNLTPKQSAETIIEKIQEYGIL